MELGQIRYKFNAKASGSQPFLVGSTLCIHIQNSYTSYIGKFACLLSLSITKFSMWFVREVLCNLPGNVSAYFFNLKKLIKILDDFNF